MDSLVDKLGRAGYHSQAIHVEQDQIKSLINHDVIFKNRELVRDPNQEKNRIKEILKKLKDWAAKVARRNEEGLDKVVLPEYCTFMHF